MTAFRTVLRKPEERVWSARSKKAIAASLKESNTVVLIGAGFEKVYRQALASRPDVIRIGLPHRGTVDSLGDFQQLPLADNSIDLLMSSSVIEHVANPGDTAAETFRALRPGGLVYCEVPFLRAFHMAPIDFQRYTVAGLVKLFEDCGFETVERGVCSGPFTAWALLVQDSVGAVLRGRLSVIGRAINLVLAWILHPIKYLDRLCEGSERAEFVACALYFVGRKPHRLSE